MITRRGLIGGILSLGMAPAIVRAQSIMTSLAPSKR